MKQFFAKLMVFLLTAAALAGVAFHAQEVKESVLEETVNSLQLLLAQVDTQQAINQIEYGLRYGKQLEHYFGIEDLLSGIHMSSSYIKGVYLTDALGTTLYSTTGTAVPEALWPLLSPAAGGEYTMYALEDTTYMAMAIADTGATAAGSVALKVDTGAMAYLVASLQEEGRLQSILIAAFTLALALIVLVRLPLFTPAGRFRPLWAALVVVLAALFALGIDTGLETYRLRQETATNVHRSAQRIAQSLQQEIDAVVSKGVGYEDIDRLEDYFDETAASVPTVEYFSLDLRNQVVAEPSETYIAERVAANAERYLAFALMVALALLPVLLAGIVWALALRRKRPAAIAAPIGEGASA